MSSDSEPTSISVRKTTKQSWMFNMGDVVSAVDHLLRGSDTRSITITKLDSSVDSFALCVTREYWELDRLTSSYEPPPTSPTPPRDALWAEMSLPQAGHGRNDHPDVGEKSDHSA